MEAENMKNKNKKHLPLLDTPSRLSAAVKNASVIARFGRLQARTGTVYYVAHENTNYRLRCYEIKTSKSKRIPIVLVPPLMISADVYDISPENSAVTYLTELGYSVWVVDFGSPEHQEGGLERDFSDHILAVNDAIEFVYKQKQLPLHLGGYSQGGIFCYLAAAYRNSQDIASIFTFGAPVNIYKNFLPGVPDEVTTRVFETVGKAIPKRLTPTAIPAWATKNLFKLMSPSKEIKRWVSFIGSLHDRDALLRTEEGRSFLGGEGFVAWPGPALYEFLQQLLMGNRLVSGGCIIEDRAISLTAITCPILVVIGSNDEIARAGSVRGVAEAVSNAELFELSVKGGHMGIVVGSGAMKNTWPAIDQWVQWREGKTDQPEPIYTLGKHVEPRNPDTHKNNTLPATMAKAAFGIGKGAFLTTGDLLGITKDSVKTVSANIGTHLSQFTRLEKLNSDSNVGLALALEEQAQKAPKDTFFLYDGRAHSYADASQRVDNIVRGLISIGVRVGDHVGIIMHARPSSLATLMAVNRLGAVAVLLRTTRNKSQLATELKLGKVQYLIADPENAPTAVANFHGQVYVLGGFGRSTRDLPDKAIDLEAINPDCITLPDWYQSSPGKARDIAFILFSKRDDETHSYSITNQRWALSALGTASSAALLRSDTAYCWIPLQNPTGLLVCVSASLVAGARVAVATKFDVPTFWKEARGYGARVVFYSGYMLRDLVDAPINKLEKGHSIRLFAGVGMPEALSKRVTTRFPSAKVMEVFVARGSNTYLANISGQKPGPVFQAIPGCSEVALVYWDYEKNRPFLDAAGYLCPVPDGTTGMLLSKTEKGTEHHGEQLIYNVFEKGDCWQISGVLFRVDEDGEYHFVDRISNLIRTKDDWLPTLTIENAAWQLDCVSAVAAYGLSLDGNEYEVPSVAIQLRAKAKFSVHEFSETVAKELDAKNRPAVVRIVDNLPMTPGQQIKKSILQTENIPDAALQRGKSYWFNPEAEQYEPLNKTSFTKLKKVFHGEDKERIETTKTTTKKPAVKQTKKRKSSRATATTAKKTTSKPLSKSPPHVGNDSIMAANRQNTTPAIPEPIDITQTAAINTAPPSANNSAGLVNGKSEGKSPQVPKHSVSQSPGGGEN